MPAEKRSQNSSSSVGSDDAPELRDRDLEQVDLGAPEGHEPSHVDDMLSRESEYSEISKEGVRPAAEIDRS